MTDKVIVVARSSSTKKDFISLEELESWCKEHVAGLYSPSLSYSQSPANEALILLDGVITTNIRTGEITELKAGQLVAKLDRDLSSLPFVEPYIEHLIESHPYNLLPILNGSIHENLVYINEERSYGLRLLPYSEIEDVIPALVIMGDLEIGMLFLFNKVIYTSAIIEAAGINMRIEFSELKENHVDINIYTDNSSKLEIDNHNYKQRIIAGYGRSVLTESQLLTRLSHEVSKIIPP